MPANLFEPHHRLWIAFTCGRCIHYRHHLRSCTLLYLIGFDWLYWPRRSLATNYYAAIPPRPTPSRHLRWPGMPLARGYRYAHHRLSWDLHPHPEIRIVSNIRYLHRRIKRWASRRTYVPYALPQTESYAVPIKVSQPEILVSQQNRGGGTGDR
ncbi:uncharacterized protein LOC108163278 isoform X2 [Drosophila miranda]|uniref:uncharacterized protein LOC108163278 isoform X2 n=1 Tax=Drosophila miranda TaxID=7229 RepID=UPI00143F2340|nr:uncharacterized protein LOC108163278 isoform X2 [Drosophila miranda]